MKIESHRSYIKRWAKLTKGQKVRAEAAVRMFLADPVNPQLRVHQIKGEWYPQYSISAGGDLRIHFTKVAHDHIIFTAIGTHSQLYK